MNYINYISRNLEKVVLEVAKEIDIVLEHDGVLNPIEIKKSSCE